MNEITRNKETMKPAKYMGCYSVSDKYQEHGVSTSTFLYKYKVDISLKTIMVSHMKAIK